MSLINDALKRANEAQKQAQGTPAKGAEPAMRPVETMKSSGSPMAAILIVALVLLLGGAGWLFLKASSASRQAAVVPQQPAPAPVVAKIEPPAPAVAPQAIAVPAPVVQAQPEVPAPVAVPVPTPAIVTAPEPAPAAAAVAVVESPKPEPVVEPPAAPTFPTVKLQGIFYNKSNPSAIVNGRTYAVGALVAGVRITKIEPENITVEWNGETWVLESAQ